MHQLLTSAVERKQSEVWKLSRVLNPKARMTRLQTHHLARKYNLPRRQPYSLFWTSAGDHDVRWNSRGKRPSHRWNVVII
jgi:hypothetical protein